jgi:hypothetical protein
MSADSRRFVYSLEVLRSRARWQQNALLSELAHTNRRVDATTSDLSRLRQEHLALAAEAAPTATCAVDPARARRVLLYLADVGRRLQSLHRQLETLEALRNGLVERTRRQELSLDGFDRHRIACLNEHIARVIHDEAVENDDQWLARMRWCALANDAQPSRRRPL